MSDRVEICSCEPGKFDVVFGFCANCAKRIERRAQPEVALERAVVEAAMEYERVRIHTQDASEWNAVKLMLREACAALDRARRGGA